MLFFQIGKCTDQRITNVADMRAPTIAMTAVCGITVGIFVAEAYGYVLVSELLSVASLLVLAATFASPWCCPPQNRMFWTTYSATALLFALLAHHSQSSVSYFIRDFVNWLAGSPLQSLVREHLYVFNSLRLGLSVICPFVFGLTSASIAEYVNQKVAQETSAKNDRGNKASQSGHNDEGKSLT